MGHANHDPRLQRVLEHPGTIAALAAAFAAFILICDASVELGVAVAICYAFVLWLIHTAGNIRWIWIAAVLCSILTLWGMVLSPGAESSAMILANRSIAILAIWLTALLCARTLSLSERGRRSDDLLRTTLASVRDAIVTTDLQGRITGVNALAASLTGWSEDDAVGCPVEDVIAIFDEDSRAPRSIPLEQVIRERDTVPIAPVLLIGRDGTERCVELTAAPIHVRRDHVAGCLIVFRDITDRRDAQRAELRSRAESDAANAKFRATFEQSSIFAGMMTVEGILTEVNTLALEVCGYEADDVLGRPFWQTGWWNGTPESQEMIRSAIDMAARGETFRGEVSYWWADRTEHIVDMALLPIRDEQGAILFLYANGVDITERKRTELALRRNADTFTRLVHGSPFGIYVVDSQFRVYQVSDGAQAAFRNVRPLIGRDFGEVMHTLWPDPFASEATAIFRHTLATGEPYVAPSLTEKRVDVDVVESYEWQVHRVTLPDGQFGVVCYFYDSTEMRRVEHALRESEQRAQRANLAKSEFLANMSHEIRTPMAAILGHADMLLAHLADPDNRQCVVTIKRNGNHLLELINDILDLSRIEAGKMDVEQQRCDLPQLLADIDSLMRVRVDEKEQLEFRVRADGQIPASLTTDPKRLKQILINLVGNAIKFTEQGHVDVCVSLMSNADGPLVRFAVEDTGIGIAPEKIEKLYQPFSQADTSVTRQFGGTGLGLTISRRLTDLLGGELELESHPGKGTTFLLTLPTGPIEGTSLVELQIESARPDVTESRELPRLACRVLLVDDRRDVRHVAQHFLEEAGATVATAEDGAQAIRAVQEATAPGEEFDVIVMDMQMPNVDGYTAVSELRAAGCGVPIIALTADAMRGDRERCLNVGCDDYLSKPIQPARLLELVKRLTVAGSADELAAARAERRRLMMTSSPDTGPAD